MMVIGKVEDGSQVVPGLIFSIPRGRGLIKYLSTDRKPFCHFTLDLPARIPVVLIVSPGVEPVTAAVARLGPPAFLKPDREEQLGSPFPRPRFWLPVGRWSIGNVPTIGLYSPS